MHFEIIPKKADKWKQYVVNLTTCSSLTLSPLFFHISSLFPSGVFMNYPCICGSTDLLTVSLSIWQVQKRMPFQPVPLSMSYLSISNNVFNPFLCMTKCFFSCVSLSLTHPVQILSGHLDWGQMPRPVAEPIDREENQGQRWLRSITLIAGTVNPYLTKVLQCVIIRLCANYSFP